MSASFALLYSLEEFYNPQLTVKVIGHQWYWTYEITHFLPPDFGPKADPIDYGTEGWPDINHMKILEA